MTLIVDSEELAAFCRRQEGVDFVAVDTEFMRDKTYWPKLCLVQVAGPKEAAAIDAMAPGIDLDPLWRLVTRSPVLKVFHAARQDIEIFVRQAGAMPAPVFDTQVAASLLGNDEQISFANLVERVTKTRLQKSHSFTDWLRRPLTTGQVEYALDDVRYLIPVYDAMARDLTALGRMAWAREEFERLEDPARYRPADPRELYLRIRGIDRMPGKALAMLRELLAWREETARTLDLPPNRIFREEVLMEVARRPRHSLKELREIRGAADAAIEQEPEQAQLRIVVDRGEVARYGVNVSGVQEVIELAVGGRPVAAMYEGDRVFDITVRYAPEARSTLAGIGNILVPAADGSRVPLARLATISVADGATIIARRENRRQISVRTNIRGRDQGGFVAEAQRRLAREVKLPPGYRVEWGGQFENLERARARLAWILPVTVAIIFGLLFWAFGSPADALLVLANVPFSIAGGIVALYLREMHFSVSAAVGFVSLFGVAVMNGVLYLTEINRQLRDYERPLREAVLVGACAQFRPRVMLILIAMLAIIPATFATGIGSDIQRPLATVIFGGLISTLVLALLGLPSLCHLFKRPKPALARPRGDALS